MPRKATPFSAIPSFRLHRLAGASERLADLNYRRRFGLRLLECRLIGVVGSHGPIAFKSVCQQAGQDKANASRLVAGLIERGWLARTPDPADSRAIRLAVTPRGRDLYRAIYAEAVQRNEQWLAVLSREQRAAFGAALDALTAQTRAMLAAERARPLKRAA